MDAQNKSAMSDRPIVRGRLHVTDRNGLEGAQQAKGGLHLWADFFQLGVAPCKARQARAVVKGVEIDGM